MKTFYLFLRAILIVGIILVLINLRNNRERDIVSVPSATATPEPPQQIDPLRGLGKNNCFGATKIKVPETDLYYLQKKDECIVPKMVVIHYTKSWTPVLSTRDILNDRRLACQFAVDEKRTIQMLDMYEDRVERASCVTGHNKHSVNIEISGDFFDDVFDRHEDPRYKDLKTSTAKAVDLTCWILKQYNIPVTEIYGHNELNEESVDPGIRYIEYFRNEVKQKCES